MSFTKYVDVSDMQDEDALLAYRVYYRLSYSQRRKLQRGEDLIAVKPVRSFLHNPDGTVEEVE